MNFAKKNTIFLIYIVFSVVCIWKHEPWFDELHALDLAAKLNWQDLLYNLQLEKHPLLFYIILKLFAFLGVILLKLSSFIILLGSGYLILYKLKNLSMSVRFFLLLNYFLFFEYGVIARAYGISNLISLLCIFLIQDEDNNNRIRRCVLITAILALPQLHFFGILQSFILFLYLKEKDYKTYLLYFLSITTSLFFILGAKDSNFLYLTTFNIYPTHLKNTLWNFLRHLIPIPLFENSLIKWNSHFFDSHKLLGISLYLPIVISLLRGLKNSKRAYILSILIACTFFTLFYTKYFGFYRHQGYFIVTLLMIYLIDEKIIFSKILKLVLFVQFLIGSVFSVSDILYSFSAGEQLASYLEEESGSKKILVDDNNYSLSLIYSTKLNITSLRNSNPFYSFKKPEDENISTNIRTSKGELRPSRVNLIDPSLCLKKCSYILNYDMSQEDQIKNQLTFIKMWPAINQSEELYLYEKSFE